MLNKVAKIITLLSASAVFLSCTIQKPAAPERSITVNGKASVQVKADMVSLNFLVRTKDWNVNKASDRNAEITNKVIEAIKTAGVSSDDISTANYNISQDLSNTFPGQYTVINNIKVLIRNTAITGNVIDGAVVAGANGLTGFTYLAEEDTSAWRQARTQAIQNAQDAANLLAGASGAKVGTVLEITEGYSTVSQPKLASTIASNSVATPIVEGSVTVESNVTVRYSLE